MMSRQMICPMCGSQFDPDAQVSCKACPLQRNCQLVCCPMCGYETVNPARSLLARLAARWFSPSAPDAQAQQAPDFSLDDQRSGATTPSQETRSTGK